MGKYRSWTDEQFIEAVASSRSVRDCLLKLGLAGKGGNYTTVHSHVQRLKLDISHWTGQGWRVGATDSVQKPIPLQEILVEDSTYTNTDRLKKRLLAEGLLVYECALCGINSWREQQITLQLDHANGISNDHRLENLRLLCPNCDSQLPTHRGKNKALLREDHEEVLLKQAGLI